jgi:hypothetical protein
MGKKSVAAAGQNAPLAWPRENGAHRRAAELCSVELHLIRGVFSDDGAVRCSAMVGHHSRCLLSAIPTHGLQVIQEQLMNDISQIAAVAPGGVSSSTRSSRRFESHSGSPGLSKSHAILSLGDYLDIDAIQSCFDAVPLDRYVEAGFRHKSICRVRVKNHAVWPSAHGPLFQPKEYNPVHGDIVRHYEEMEPRLAVLLQPIIQIFAACALLRHDHEVLVQAQRITASSGEDGTMGFPVVEGWHRDNTQVLGIFLVNRVNVEGGISLLSRDSSGDKLAFARTLGVGELLLIDDTVNWHNTTPIKKVRENAPAHRDVVLLTWPSCREL